MRAESDSSRAVGRPRSSSTGLPGSTVDAVATPAELTVRAVTSELASVRRWVRRVLEEQGAGSDVADDIELAASELATNVIRHTVSDTIRLHLARGDDAWILDVADADDAPAPAAQRLPPSDDPTGRGLYVVASVMDGVELVDSQGIRTIRCTRLDVS